MKILFSQSFLSVSCFLRKEFGSGRTLVGWSNIGLIRHWSKTKVTMVTLFLSEIPPPTQPAPSWPGATSTTPAPPVPPLSDGTPWAADTTPWPEQPGGAWGDIQQPALPPKQNPRPASVQRKGPKDNVNSHVVLLILTLILN
jgi:hypothetical protein